MKKQIKNFCILISDDQNDLDILKIFDKNGNTVSDLNRNKNSLYNDYKINSLSLLLENISKNIDSKFKGLEIKTNKG